MPFENRVAIVTGGASGIGKALCDELARRGARVVAADMDFAGAQAVAAAITAAGGRASAAHLDVRQSADVKAIADVTARDHGSLDFMFNNAGIGVGGEMRELSLEHWRAAVEVNLMGVVHGVLAAYPVMLRQGTGHIVNIASLAGLVCAPGLGPYATTKSAVVALSNSLRAEAEGYGVRVSVVCPGFVQTAIFDHAIGVKLEKQALLQNLKLPLIPAEDAARSILRGVERNQGTIVFPASARLLWRLTRLSPWLLLPFHRRMLARLRTVPRRIE